MNNSTTTLIMRLSLALLFVLVSPLTTGSKTIKMQVLTDFTSDSADLGWYIVNDSVMGGRSSGDIEQRGETLYFTGSTNTNGGGFSSIRTRTLDLDLSNYSGIQIRVKGDGRRYTWRISTNARWRGRLISYWADFDTAKDTWKSIKIPLTDFKPQFRGYKLAGPDLDTTQISAMGLMIYDKQDGPFHLELASVHAYLDKL